MIAYQYSYSEQASRDMYMPVQVLCACAGKREGTAREQGTLIALWALGEYGVEVTVSPA